MLFDKYSGQNISEKSLPDHIDFGRYLFYDNNTEFSELTYSVFPTNKTIHQELLLDKHKNIQENFIDISIDILKTEENDFHVIPLIRRIKNKLGLNYFEIMLYEKIFHIEEIFRQPHYLLEREIDKVHVSRAKRIPSKSYQYLASHTEDWIHKSIVKFKPSRILNEDLQLNYDVYENQITVSLLERCLIYLNSRLKEIQDIKLFLNEYALLLNNRNDQKGWYKKIERNLRLIGEVYEDEHYQGKGEDSTILTHTEEILNQMNKRLLRLRNSEIYEVVNKRIIINATLRNTNVLVNHKHYRYVRTLWQELDKIRPEKSEIEKSNYEKDVYDGVLSYANSIIAYCLKNLLNYNITGNYSAYDCKLKHYSDVNAKLTDKRIIQIMIGKNIFNIAVIGNAPAEPNIINKVLEESNTYILYYSEANENFGNRIININPLDPDSVERVGGLLRKYLLREYLHNIYKNYEYKHMLKEYTRLFTNEYITFDNLQYSYTYISYPNKIIEIEEIKNAVEQDQKYRSKKSRIEKDKLLKEVIKLAEDINNNSQILIKQHLFCFTCGEPLKSYEVSNLRYIKCHNCNSLLDSTNKDKIIYKVEDDNHICQDTDDYGIDYLEFRINNI